MLNEASHGRYWTVSLMVLDKLAVPNQEVFNANFFMYGDDLDLCIRTTRAGYKIRYDGRMQITHLKGQSVAKNYDTISAAIFDANREVYLKYFGTSALAQAKWRAMFGLWKFTALLRARLKGHRKVRPL